MNPMPSFVRALSGGLLCFLCLTQVAYAQDTTDQETPDQEAPKPTPETEPAPEAKTPLKVDKADVEAKADKPKVNEPVVKPQKPKVVPRKVKVGPPKLPSKQIRPKRRLPPPEMITVDQVGPPSKKDELDINVSAEYRLRTTQIDPLDLSGERVTETTWTEQRLRMKLDMGYEKLVKLNVTMDALDGVLFGDNGSFNGDPASISGVSLAAKRPNLARWDVGLRPNATNPLNSDQYEPQLIAAEPLTFIHAYADVILPVGILRVGRQPQTYGAQLASHEGNRINRWGASTLADVSDRILFGTKLDEAYYIMRDGAEHTPDFSQNKGVFFAVFHDWLAQDSVLGTSDDTTQIGAALQYKREQADWFGLDWRNIFLGAALINLNNERFASNAWGLPLRASGEVEDLAFEFQSMLIRGTSREVSEGFAALRSLEGTDQDIEGMGLRGVLDYKLGPVTLTLEGDYAQGDDDPRPETPITVFNFARSFNVGLLLFEHIIAFESARSVAVGIENLRQQNAESFPLTEARTEGRFTNAAAFFPQVKVDVMDTGKHKLHTRFGALMAWPATSGVVDPIGTILAQDGKDIDDDAVNYHGGDPGGYYGTELDVQVEWSIAGHFFWTLEGAYLIPGSSLQDENGDVVPAYLLENRFTYAF